MAKILIVDDMMVNRILMKSLLSKLSLSEDKEFVEAADGEKALAIISEQDIDLIVLDLIMPVMDGFDVLKKLKEDNYTIPVIINSASDESESVQKALEMGAYDYFTKPLTTQQLKVVLPLKVENALRNYRQQKELDRINRQLQEEKEMAKCLRHDLLNAPPQLSRAQLHSFYRPAPEGGGCFYVCREIADKLWFMVGDTSGYGVASALLSAMIMAEFNIFIDSETGPASVLDKINSNIYLNTGGRHTLTAFLGVLQDKQLVYANGGHPEPVLIRVDESTAVLAHKGEAIGLSDGTGYDDKQLVVNSGEILIIYTGYLYESIGIKDKYSHEDWHHYFFDNKKVIMENPRAVIQELEAAVNNGDAPVSEHDAALVMLRFS